MYKKRQFAPKAHIMEITHDSIFPGGVICLFKVKEDRYKVLASSEGIAYHCFKSDKVI